MNGVGGLKKETCWFYGIMLFYGAMFYHDYFIHLQMQQNKKLFVKINT